MSRAQTEWVKCACCEILTALSTLLTTWFVRGWRRRSIMVSLTKASQIQAMKSKAEYFHISSSIYTHKEGRDWRRLWMNLQEEPGVLQPFWTVPLQLNFTSNSSCPLKSSWSFNWFILSISICKASGLGFVILLSFNFLKWWQSKLYYICADFFVK